jgi:membrane protease YdiL (CAAX protease family)
MNTPSPDKLRLLVRVGVFVVLALLGRLVFPVVLQPFGGVLVVSALSTFATAAVANFVVVRGWENGKAADCGLGWSRGSGRELAIGVAGGAGSVALIVCIALISRLAALDAVPGVARTWANIPFLGVVLLFGAVGEELLFHGYAFQTLVRNAGAFATVLPVGILFGLAHVGNQNVTGLAIVNTIAWGVLLGCAYLRTRALWMPIGLHFGWNVAMPFLGLNLSGFTMGVTGYALRWRMDDLWSGGGYGLEGGLFTTLIVSALFFLLYRVIPARD